MIIESLNVNLPKKENFHGKGVRTEICKNPISGPVRLGPEMESNGIRSQQSTNGVC